MIGQTKTQTTFTTLYMDTISSFLWSISKLIIKPLNQTIKQ